jgi:hypothetical protein
VIQIVAIDTFAALNSGAYVLSENYLYTVESMQEMLNHLNPDGLFCCLRWNSVPPRESLRLTSLMCEALKRDGCRTIDEQIVIVRYDKWALNMIKKSPYLPAEIKIILDAAKRHHMELLYIPKVFERQDQLLLDEKNLAALDADGKTCSKAWGDLIKSYATGNEQQFFSSYPYLVSPTTDDSPFFFEYHRKNVDSRWLNLDEQRGDTARMTLNLVLTQSTLFTLFAIVMPLLTFRRKGMMVKHALPFTIYFASVGFGFMLIELALIQKCVLFLGNPIYSLSLVLATLLVSAGLGSWMVTKTGWVVRKVLLVFGSLFLIFFVTLVFSINPLIGSLMHLPLHLRMLATACMLFPSGLLMGVFFPTGLQAVRSGAPNYLPWAWGINGCASVYGSFAAIVFAIGAGFTNTLLLGAFVYLLGFIAAWQFGAPSAEPQDH